MQGPTTSATPSAVPPPPVVPMSISQYYQFFSFRHAVQSRMAAARSLAKGRVCDAPPPARRRIALAGGRLVVHVASDAIVGAMLWLAIILLAAVFFLVVAPSASSKVVESIAANRMNGSYAISVVAASLARRAVYDAYVIPLCAVLFVITEALLLWLLVSDPGIINRRAEADDEEGAEAMPMATGRSSGGIVRHAEIEQQALERLPNPVPQEWSESHKRSVLETVVEQIFVETELIETIEQDLHTCPVCRVKVRGFDHHCSIVGACIGCRNFGVFVAFLVVASVLLTLASAVAGPLLVVHIFENQYVNQSDLFDIPTTLCTVIFAVVALYLGLFTSAMSIFYIFLAARGEQSIGRRKRAELRAEHQLVQENVNLAELQPYHVWRKVKSRAEKLTFSSLRWGNLVTALVTEWPPQLAPE